ncbi:MAG TPA: hypothetical protein VLM11_22400 [Streptosporangiaceae bacterium]|nr:hypothetical protein [Streptosporangiaceae bacterium]
MTDLQEQRLRDAIAASVEDAQPTFDVMAAVRSRHRRYRLRVAAGWAGAVCALVVLLVVGIHVALGPVNPAGVGPSKHVKTPAGPLSFPGGGRLLMAGGGVLTWVYPDGRTALIPGDFDGATVSSGGLLAWKYSVPGAGYYTMTFDGANQRLVLPADRNPQVSMIAAQVSPDGTQLAYIRQDMTPTKVTNTLCVLEMATGRRVKLGMASDSAFAWRDASTILTAAADQRSLVLVSVPTGNRSTYLSVTDPALVSAYERARPGAGPPTSIGSDGMAGSGSSALIAVWLAAADPRLSGGVTSPADVVMAGSRPVATYAPRTPDALNLSFGPRGLVVLQTGAGDNPATWDTYVGSLRGPRLSVPVPFGMDGVIFNPAGDVMALRDAGNETFVPTPAPACRLTARCLHFTPIGLSQPGTIQAWLP